MHACADLGIFASFHLMYIILCETDQQKNTHCVDLRLSPVLPRLGNMNSVGLCGSVICTQCYTLYCANMDLTNATLVPILICPKKILVKGYVVSV